MKFSKYVRNNAFGLAVAVATVLFVATVAMAVADRPSLEPAVMPSGEAGTSYTQTVIWPASANLGWFTVSGGTLPPGLSLDAYTGEVTGVPTVPGEYVFTVVGYGDDAPLTQDLQMTVGMPSASITIETAALPAAQAGGFYLAWLTARGGTASYTWSVVQGALPDGLTLLGNEGTIRGWPTIAGTTALTLQAADNLGNTATQDVSIVVNPPMPPNE